MRIDAHQHFWTLARGDYGWLTDETHPRIYRDFGPSDLEPLLKENGIQRTILVQAAPTADETAFLIKLAQATPFVAGVVGWVDLEADDATAVIERLSDEALLLGIRPMLQDIADDDWILSPRLDPALRCLTDMQLCFDALIKPRHLRMLLKFMDRYPDLPVVIDHGAKPDIARGSFEPWAADIRDLARAAPVMCKLSGLASEVGENWSAEQLKPYADVLLECFGADRLMWGSDWPVLNEVGTYRSWCRAAGKLTESLSDSEQEKIFGGTAAKFYGLVV
jgi:L-fucono-1,5-lactonase